MLMLANRADADGSAIFPGLDAVAEDTRMSRRQVIRIIDKLLESGELVEVPGRSPLGTKQYDMPGVRGDEIPSDKVSPEPEVTNRRPEVTDRTSESDISSNGSDIAVSSNQSLDHPLDQPLELAPTSSTRQRDPIFDALCEACGQDPGDQTRSGSRTVGVAAADLRRVGATAQEIFRRALNYPTHFEGAALTPSALAKHWAQCAEPKQRTGEARNTFLEAVRMREEEDRARERSLSSGS